MPRARPETTANPSRPSDAASVRAILMPASEALRAPTMATGGSEKTAGSPLTASSGGGWSMRLRIGG